MLQKDDFSYGKATNICCMHLIFRNLFFLSTLVFTYANASNSHILQYQGPIGVRRTPNQTDSDVAFSRSCNQGKITKKN